MPNKLPKVAKDQDLSIETLTALEEHPLDEKIPLEEKNKKIFAAGIFFFIIIVLGTCGTYYFASKITPETGIATKIPPPTNSTTPKPPDQNLPRSAITLEILNGSGIPGAAAKTAKTFQDLGYVITLTGNTNSIGASQILVIPSLKDRLGLLLQDLEANLNISSVSGSLTDSTASARIILGD